MNINPNEIPEQNIEQTDTIHQERLAIALKNGYSEDEPDFNSPLDIETYLETYPSI